MWGTVAVMEVQETPQGSTIFRLGMVKIVAGFCDQAAVNDSNNEKSKNLLLIRSVLSEII
jgi:hypothetical protein